MVEDIDKASLMRIIASKLTILRKRFNLSKHELSRKSGISRPMIIAIENSRSMPTVFTLVMLIRVFEISLDEFLN